MLAILAIFVALGMAMDVESCYAKYGLSQIIMSAGNSENAELNECFVRAHESDNLEIEQVDE